MPYPHLDSRTNRGDIAEWVALKNSVQQLLHSCRDNLDSCMDMAAAAEAVALNHPALVDHSHKGYADEAALSYRDWVVYSCKDQVDS